MAQNQYIALPTEPLLDTPTHLLGRVRIEREAVDLLEELAGESDVASRSRALYGWLRKRLGEPSLVGALEGIVAASASGQPFGVAALAALLAVRAPGPEVIERIREFRSLHRIAQRYQHRRDRAKVLSAAECDLLDRLARAQERHAHVLDKVGHDAGGLPSPLDLGPARVPRLAFAAVVRQLDERGVLAEAAISCFVELARLELLASEQRASELAGSINPYSSRAVSLVMPILSGADSEVRDHLAFVEALEQHGRSAIFQEQHPLLRDYLETDEIRRLLSRVGLEPRLQLVRRLLSGIQRSPLPGRMLAYYAERLLGLGVVLHEAGLRPRALDAVEAVLLALDFNADRCVTLPAGREVCAALQPALPAGVELADGILRLPFDPSAARRVYAPVGLPLPLAPTEATPQDEFATIKDLVLANITNTSVLLGLLKNSKVISTPGLVAMVAVSCRNLRVLELICESKPLHSGYANKNVPLLLLRSPVRLPVKALRKFIHVKYTSKLELKRLLNDRTGLRREVYDEVKAYLDGLD